MRETSKNQNVNHSQHYANITNNHEINSRNEEIHKQRTDKSHKQKTLANYDLY